MNREQEIHLQDHECNQVRKRKQLVFLLNSFYFQLLVVHSKFPMSACTFTISAYQHALVVLAIAGIPRVIRTHRNTIGKGNL